MSVKSTLLVILAVLTVFTASYLIQIRNGRPHEDGSAPVAPPANQSQSGRQLVPPHQPTPVASNRGPEVLDGFRGDVHPLLSGQTRLVVTAEWTPVGKGRDHIDVDLNPALYAWFTNLQPVQPRQTYTERDFSAFLPESVGEVGQLWALDADKIIEILKQFHRNPSLNLVAAGRRAGPDGAFAILRAVSPSYLDIVFRIHAEFSLIPEPVRADQPHFRAWFTPAYFSGRVVVNRRTGKVDYFRLGLPTNKALNVHLTLVARGMGPNWTQAHDVVRVEQMSLSGGDSGPVKNIAWTKALDPAEADRRLAKVFFKFLDIHWVPFDQVLAQARSRRLPIFAVVSWGAFEDQSC